jgi:hypothetical protein
MRRRRMTDYDPILDAETVRRLIYEAAHATNAPELRAILARLAAHDEALRAEIKRLTALTLHT